jgi:hypothetical protein
MLKRSKIISIVGAFIFAVAALALTPQGFAANGMSPSRVEAKPVDKKARVEVPLNLAILIQDDVIAGVGNELPLTREFIRSLPAGSRVMIGYIGSGSLQVREPFTEDLEGAVKALRIPLASTSASPYNPYVEVIEALRRFDEQSKNRNAILLVSDGLDTSHGFDASSAGNTPDLLRAIREAQKRNVAVYSFYTPTVGLTSRSSLAASYGQGSLNRLSNETGGRAFFQGLTSFVSFDPYFEGLRRALNEQYAAAH